MEGNRDSELEIVIAGFSGRFPKSANVGEFWENLINGVDMVTESNERYNAEEFDIPSRRGVLVDLDRFDANFFGINSAMEISAIEPKLRKLLEAAYEAILDSGTNPTTIRGSKTGVFVGSTDGEALPIMKRRDGHISPYTATGFLLCMMSNRLSNLLDFHGPSFSMDTGCSSGGTAMHQALLAIRAGVCDAAIVAAANIILDPLSSKHFHMLGATSNDGKCKSFDASADGFCRSEAVVAIYICKKELAKRSYATIVEVAINSDGYKTDGIIHPSGNSQAEVMMQVYRRCGVDPLELDYLEAHGSGTSVGDPEEVRGISLALCKGRKRPLAIGSIKSNMGHGEIASALCGVVKVLLSHNVGILPGNLHYKNPNPDIPSLWNGELQVVDKNQPFNAKYVGFNSIGFGGVNSHFVLKMAHREEQPNEWKPQIPVIIAFSARTQTGIDCLLQKSLQKWNNRNFVGLLHEIYKNDIPNFGFRGFVVVSSLQDIETFSEVVDKERYPTWFIYTGLGSQWLGMERDLMKFDCFKNSMEASANILQNYSFDLMATLIHSDAKTLDSLKNALVSINAMQIALTDLLASLGIKPDGIVGHSTGEMAAAYADECFTQEQALLVTLFQSRPFLESELPPGTLATVGLTWEDALKLCPQDIYPAIHTAKDEVTIAGPVDAVNDFVSKLTNEGTFAEIVSSASFAFHSPLVKDCGVLARGWYEEIIPEPKHRSNKWLSTSVPRDEWDSELATYCSADYFVNNMIAPVHFYTTILELPDEAIALEISPHCYMQSILKQSLSKNAVTLGLMNCECRNNGSYFLNSMGKCYTSGLNLDFSKLYEPLQFPVSADTPNISSLVRWDHSDIHEIPHYKMERSYQRGVKIICDLNSDDEKYLEGHSVNGKVLYPAVGYLVLAWKVFAQYRGILFQKCPVVLENIKFHRATVLSRNTKTEFLICITLHNGQFEITESGKLVCSGIVRNVEEGISSEMFSRECMENVVMSGPALTKEDFYKEAHIRNYGHSKKFQGVTEIATDGAWCKVKWLGEWVSFLDSVLQLTLLRKFDRDLVVPTRLQKLTIDPNEVWRNLKMNDYLADVRYQSALDYIKTRGVEIRGFGLSILPISHHFNSLCINKQTFFPYLETPAMLQSLSEKETIQTLIQIVFENSWQPQFHCGYVYEGTSARLALEITEREWHMRFPKREFLVNSISFEEYSGKDGMPSSKERYHLIFVNVVIENLKELVHSKGFILFLGTSSPDISGMEVISKKSFKLENDQGSQPIFWAHYLLKPTSTLPPKRIVVSIDEVDFRWIQKAKEATDNLFNLDRIYFQAHQEKSGIVGFIKCLICELTSEKIRCFRSSGGPPMDLESPSKMLEVQMKKDLVFNLYENSTWGHLCHLPIQEEICRKRLSKYVYANTLVHGDLSSFTWIESPLILAVGKDLVEIHYSALNFRDILLASGKITKELFVAVGIRPMDSYIGIEYSGIYKGKRVCGMGDGSCLATWVQPVEHLMAEIPDDWTLLEGSTLYVAYRTAYVAFILQAKLTAGQTVLIHSGCGGLGLAAIELALEMKCKVFTTVSSMEKREFLKKRFPSLTNESFANSRDADEFESHIRLQTKGRGVDVVLNSLTGNMLFASIRCLAFMGKFIEIGKVDILNDTPIGMSILMKGITISTVLGLIETLNEELARPFNKFLEDRMRSGLIRPLPTQIFKHSEVESAFRFMSKGKHIGKIVIQVKENESVPSFLEALPRTHFHPKKTYIIVGGLGGMGFEMADWMIQRDAKNIVLTSRTGILSSYHRYHLANWERKKVRVVIDTSDVTTVQGATVLLENAQTMGEIGGIFNTALVLNDGTFKNQSEGAFENVSKCKADATQHLDTMSRSLAPHLDYFVVFSSLAAGRGNDGQTNYGLANSVMERICEQRRSEGLPALAVQWGAVADVGFFHRRKIQMRNAVYAEQKIQSCLDTLDLLLQQKSNAVVDSYALTDSTGSTSQDSVNDNLISVIANKLGIKDLGKVDMQVPLVGMGMDSIMTIEIGNVLEYRLGREFSKKELSTLTFAKLAKLDAETSNEEAGNRVTNYQQEHADSCS